MSRILLNFTKYSQIRPQIHQLINKNQFYSTKPQQTTIYDLNSKITQQQQVNINHQLIATDILRHSTFIRQYADLPDLPPKSKVEKYAFKTIGLMLDITRFLILWTLKVIHKYIINNSKVQNSWKLLQKKIDNARKN